MNDIYHFFDFTKIATPIFFNKLGGVLKCSIGAFWKFDPGDTLQYTWIVSAKIENLFLGQL